MMNSRTMGNVAQMCHYGLYSISSEVLHLPIDGRLRNLNPGKVLKHWFVGEAESKWIIGYLPIDGRLRNLNPGKVPKQTIHSYCVHWFVRSPKPTTYIQWPVQPTLHKQIHHK